VLAWAPCLPLALLTLACLELTGACLFNLSLLDSLGVDLATSVRAAAPVAEGPAGRAVLNIGFGMGIVDGALQRRRPGRHVIVEAHPAVIKKKSRNAPRPLLSAALHSCAASAAPLWRV